MLITSKWRDQMQISLTVIESTGCGKARVPDREAEAMQTNAILADSY